MTRPDSAVAVGVDIGGTKLVAAAVAADGTVLQRLRRASPVGDADGLVDAVVACASELGPGLAVGVGVAGIVDADGTLVEGPNLRLSRVPLGSRLRARLQVHVAVGNDANVAMWGEFVAGAARDVRHAVMFTLGTGVGGGLVIDGELVEGARGYAGELGHIIIEEGGRLCPCGNEGCVEAYASGNAIAARARERLAAGERSDLLGGPDGTATIDGRAVTRAALDGDPLSRAVLEDTGTWLGVAMANIVNATDPELVVVGGGAATLSAGFILPAATASMRPRLLGHEHREPPHVVLAELGDDAGMVGAALLAAHRAA